MLVAQVGEEVVDLRVQLKWGGSWPPGPGYQADPLIEQGGDFRRVAFRPGCSTGCAVPPGSSAGIEALSARLEQGPVFGKRTQYASGSSEAGPWKSSPLYCKGTGDAGSPPMSGGAGRRQRLRRRYGPGIGGWHRLSSRCRKAQFVRRTFPAPPGRGRGLPGAGTLSAEVLTRLFQMNATLERRPTPRPAGPNCRIRVTLPGTWMPSPTHRGDRLPRRSSPPCIYSA